MTDASQPDVKLLMESRGFSAGTRSTFSKTWSKLFQVGPYFVDVSCTPEGNQARFEGQVMREHQVLSEGRINLKGAKTLNTQLDDHGYFGVFIEEPGIHALELILGTDHFSINNLTLT